MVIALCGLEDGYSTVWSGRCLNTVWFGRWLQDCVVWETVITLHNLGDGFKTVCLVDDNAIV
jgi:hypothetical protein